ncbi:MAG: peptidoglycan-binding protein [Candidatus Brennerbacteria bacterium]|nr:peptidoglycan-binding protein [Candidatus Brennerbacteria bacterium]
MRKIILFGVAAVMSFSLTATSVSAALTEFQIQSILTLLQSFGVDQAVLNNVNGALRGQAASSPVSSIFCFDFNRNLKFGDGLNELEETNVRNLQTALEKEGFPVSDAEKKGGAVFQEATASAVVGFQEKYRAEILAPNGLPRGTGYVGPATRAKLDKLYGCTAADSDKSPDYSVKPPYNITPQSYPDLFVPGVGKGIYGGGSVSCIYGTEPDPLTCKSTVSNRTVYHDHCANPSQLNEAFVRGDGRLEAHGVFPPSGYICEKGRFIAVPTTANPSVAFVSEPKAGSGGSVLIKRGDKIVFTGTPVDLPGKLGVDYERAFLFDPIFNGVCSNTDWVLTCTPTATGEGDVYILLYKGGQTYRSDVIHVVVSP